METHFDKHHVLLKALDDAAEKLFAEGGIPSADEKQNADFKNRLASEWQDALDD